MPDIFFDFGNADVKYFDGEQSYGYFRHAIVEISESQWREVCGRAKQPPQGYIAIEGRYFAYGEKARRHALKEKPRGASRYVADYYGVALMAAISELYDSSHRVINVYASHAPRDFEYADDIRDASLGRWKFVTYKGSYNINIKTVETFDEPLGGFNHVMLTKNGKVLKSNPYRQSTVLVVDVGGYTVDVVAVDPGGQIDDSSLGSTVTGVIDTFNWFERELRSLYRSEFKDVESILPERLESAMLNGFYQFGKLELDCSAIGNQAINMLVNDILSVIRANGSIGNYDVILLTGGGSALVYDAIRQAEQRIDFILVESRRKDMRYANVFGGAKLFTMLKLLGVI